MGRRTSSNWRACRTASQCSRTAGVEVPEPGSLGPDDSTPYTAPFTACWNVALLRSLLEAAGDDLNYGSLAAAPTAWRWLFRPRPSPSPTGRRPWPTAIPRCTSPTGTLTRAPRTASSWSGPDRPQETAIRVRVTLSRSSRTAADPPSDRGETRLSPPRPRGGLSLTLRDAGDDRAAMAPKLAAMGYRGIELYSGQLTAVDPNVFLDVLGVAAMTAYPDYAAVQCPTGSSRLPGHPPSLTLRTEHPDPSRAAFALGTTRVRSTTRVTQREAPTRSRCPARAPHRRAADQPARARAAACRSAGRRG